MEFWQFWFGCIALSGVIAAFKRRSIIFWPLVTIVLGPIGVVWILALKKAVKPRPLIVPTLAEVDAIHLTTGDSVSGLRASITILEGGIKIRRDDGARNALLHGIKGEKSIGFRSITAVQLRMPTPLMSGYIQFSVVGGIEGGRGIFEAAKDENSVLFVDTQSARMMALRKFAERQINAPQITAAPVSLADELTKLADLKDRGAITVEEFEAKKAVLFR